MANQKNKLTNRLNQENQENKLTDHLTDTNSLLPISDDVSTFILHSCDMFVSNHRDVVTGLRYARQDDLFLIYNQRLSELKDLCLDYREYYLRKEPFPFNCDNARSFLTVLEYTIREYRYYYKFHFINTDSAYSTLLVQNTLYSASCVYLKCYTEASKL